MSSVNTTVATDSPCTDKRGLNDLVAELTLEICSYLEVHDQQAVRRVCKRWKSDLCGMFLSRFVNMDVARMPKNALCHDFLPHNPQKYVYLEDSETCLDQALNLHIQKNTKVLVLRHVVSDGAQFGIVARIIQEKQADLLQLVLQDCEVEQEYAAAACWWRNPQQIHDRMMQGLIFVTKRLVLTNYTISHVFGGAVSLFLHGGMPGSERLSLLSQLLVGTPPPSKKLRVVLPRHEFDCSKPFVAHYDSFIMALESHCPEVSPEVRNDVVRLYNSWIRNDNIAEQQWHSLGVVLQCFNEGIPATKEDLEVNVAALRQQDPQTLNKLTMEALHRIYYPWRPCNACIVLNRVYHTNCRHSDST